MQNVYRCIITTLIISSLFLGKAAAIDMFVEIDPDRDIHHPTIGNDLFEPLPFDRTGNTSEVVEPKDSFNLNYTFDTPIKLEDTGFDSDESIHITLENLTGSMGGTNDQIIDSGTKVDFVFTLTGVVDDVTPRTTITFSGTLPTETGSGGALVLEDTDREITNDSIVFSDLHLMLTPVNGMLAFNKITLGVDADKVSAPEPASYMLILAVLALVRFVAVKQKRLKR